MKKKEIESPKLTANFLVWIGLFVSYACGRRPFCVETLLGSLRNLEARVGIEPTHKGFADLSLTTWVPRPVEY